MHIILSITCIYILLGTVIEEHAPKCKCMPRRLRGCQTNWKLMGSCERDRRDRGKSKRKYCCQLSNAQESKDE